MELEGWEAHIICDYDNIEAYDLKSTYHYVNFDKSINLWKNIKSLIQIYKIIKLEKPDVILSFTIKPNIFFSVLKIFFNYKLVLNISGLGSMFSKSKPLWYQYIFKLLYVFAIKFADHSFFQNKESINSLGSKNFESKYSLLPGSGIQIPSNMKVYQSNDEFKFIFVGRLIEEKGFILFCKAAHIISKKYKNCRFLLYGYTSQEGLGDYDNKSVKLICKRNSVEWCGSTNDIKKVMLESDALIFPSYYNEGTPRVLLEAGSLGLISITSSWPGCADIIEDGRNGFLFEVKNHLDIVAKIEQFLQLNVDERVAMGRCARSKVQTHYDVKIVLDTYLDVIKTLTK